MTSFVDAPVPGFETLGYGDVHVPKRNLDLNSGQPLPAKQRLGLEKPGKIRTVEEGDRTPHVRLEAKVNYGSIRLSLTGGGGAKWGVVYIYRPQQDGKIL